jgi:hypothetical protein
LDTSRCLLCGHPACDHPDQPFRYVLRAMITRTIGRLLAPAVSANETQVSKAGHPVRLSPSTSTPTSAGTVARRRVTGEGKPYDTAAKGVTSGCAI